MKIWHVAFHTEGNTSLIIEYSYIIKRKWNMFNLLLLILSDIFVTLNMSNWQIFLVYMAKMP